MITFERSCDQSGKKEERKTGERMSRESGRALQFLNEWRLAVSHQVNTVAVPQQRPRVILHARGATHVAKHHDSRSASELRL